ncbi:glycosyltransferase [Leeia oryzae]|uniref:glycosyltransferase n=1 Tax=Leeia oryzae TaxID=356662 RepID=UPI00036F3CE9|nr:glycosyltransferase [Leeia oryzae]
MTPVCQTLVLIGSDSIHTQRFLRGIAGYCGKVVLISNGQPDASYRPDNLAAVHIVNFSLKSFKTTRIIRQVLQQYQPDMVHVQQANSVAWHAARALSGSTTPWVLSCWGSDVLLLPKRNWLMHQMVRYNLRAATAVTADSDYLLDAASQLAGKPLKREMLLFGLEQLPPPPYNFAERPKRLLSCRLHKPLYRIDAIISAFARLVSEGKADGWTLEVAARGEDTGALTKLAAERQVNDQIVFSGFLPHAELLQHYEAARIFVSVPESDSTPVSLLEAMGYGCIPVLSDLPANREWVTDGVNGFICTEMSSLADVLEKAMQLADNPDVQPLLQGNYQRIEEKAMYAGNMSRFAALYASILSPHAAAIH